MKGNRNFLSYQKPRRNSKPWTVILITIDCVQREDNPSSSVCIAIIVYRFIPQFMETIQYT